MWPLDDPRRLREIDPSDMLGLVARLPAQLAEGRRLAQEVGVRTTYPRRVFIAGMGGSAIAGDLAAAAGPGKRSPEVTVVRNYHLPPPAGREDLVIALSYSGNTEETLACFHEALDRGCPLLAVASGGRLLEAAERRAVPCVQVPGGLPPRGALGYLFGATAALLDAAGAGGYDHDLAALPRHLEGLAAALLPGVPLEKNPAKALAQRLHGRTPIVYATPALGPVARRWQTQLNENAKLLAWHGLLPEIDHNELVGWANDGRRSSFAAVFLRDQREAPAMEARLAATRELMGPAVVETLTASGRTPLERLFGLVHLGDFVSVYLAVLNGVDPTPVAVIEELKARLAGPR